MKTVLVALTCFILGGATFYGYSQYQKMNEENRTLKMKLEKSTSMTVGVSENTKVSVTPEEKKMTSKKEEMGSIQGVLGYPAGGIPELEVYAFDAMDEKKFYMIQTKANQTEFVIEGVNPGKYHVVAYTKDAALSGAYSKMVPCGLSVDCKDHSMIDVMVQAGEVTSKVEVKDWYAPEGSFPKKP